MLVKTNSGHFMNSFSIHLLPFWLIFLVTLTICLLSFEGGFRWAKSRGRGDQGKKFSTTVGSTLGLLALILAFTFSLAATRFLERRQLVIDDANAIETTYRRADYLAEPERSEIRGLLRDYSHYRMPSSDPVKLQETIAKAEEIQDQIWSQAIVVAQKYPTSVVGGLFITSLNQMLDLHVERLMVAARTRIPGMVWGVLYIVTILSLGVVGYYAGLTGSRCYPIHFSMILIFSLVIFLIADLDFSQKGIIKVSQQPILELVKKMGEKH